MAIVAVLLLFCEGSSPITHDVDNWHALPCKLQHCCRDHVIAPGVGVVADRADEVVASGARKGRGAYHLDEVEQAVLSRVYQHMLNEAVKDLHMHVHMHAYID